MSQKHILKPFDRDLKLVKERVIGMAEMVLREFTDCCRAFADRDKLEASDAVAADTLINASERIIDDLVIKAIVRHQPMASDCRLLVAALRISKDLERIGDYATNIANHSTTLDELSPTGEEQSVVEMSRAVRTMIDHVIEAYSNDDPVAAEKVRQEDEAVDKMYTDIFTQLIRISSDNPQLSGACIHLTLVARSLERIGDHLTDIAEEIIFAITGDLPNEPRHKADRSAFVK